jgi:hypothetical protein
MRHREMFVGPGLPAGAQLVVSNFSWWHDMRRDSAHRKQDARGIKHYCCA